MIAAAVILLCVQEPALAAPGFELPRGPAARAFESVGAAPASAKLDWTGLPLEADAPQWRANATWTRWAQWVREQARASEPQRAAKLALLARLQGRDDDAWDHAANAAAAPEIGAALLPLFLPGVEAPLLARGLQSPGGVALGLPDGALLAPALPPAAVTATEIELGLARIDRRSMRASGIEVGAAKIAMTVALESDGIQIDLAHLEGGPARVRVLLPEPPDFEIYVEYLDWFRREELRAPIEVELAPGAEPRTLFGRFRPRRMPWPSREPQRLPVALERCGIEIRVPAESAIAPLARAASSGFGALLGIPCVVRDPDASAPREDADGPSPIVVDLSAPGLAVRKLAAIVSLAERWGLTHGR